MIYSICIWIEKAPTVQVTHDAFRSKANVCFMLLWLAAKIKSIFTCLFIVFLFYLKKSLFAYELIATLGQMSQGGECGALVLVKDK